MTPSGRITIATARLRAMSADRPRIHGRAAAAIDEACLGIFVIIGLASHHRNVGAFFRVLWPLTIGWFAVALVTGLYRRDDRRWLRLALTWVGGILVAALRRGAFTSRPTFSAFTVVLAVFVGAATFGWRGAVAFALYRRTRQTAGLRRVEDDRQRAGRAESPADDVAHVDVGIEAQVREPIED